MREMEGWPGGRWRAGQEGDGGPAGREMEGWLGVCTCRNEAGVPETEKCSSLLEQQASQRNDFF